MCGHSPYLLPTACNNNSSNQSGNLLPDSKPQMAAWTFLRARNEKKMETPETVPITAKTILTTSPLLLLSIGKCLVVGEWNRKAFSRRSTTPYLTGFSIKGKISLLFKEVPFASVRLSDIVPVIRVEILKLFLFRKRLF